MLELSHPGRAGDLGICGEDQDNTGFKRGSRAKRGWLIRNQEHFGFIGKEGTRGRSISFALIAILSTALVFISTPPSCSSNGWSPVQGLYPASSEYTYPMIALDSGNHPHVVWRGYDGSIDQIYYSANFGMGWSEPEILSTAGSTDNRHPQIALDSEDHPHVVWYGWDDKYKVYYSSNFGEGWSGPTLLSHPGSTSNVSPKITLDSADHPHVVWDGGNGICYSTNLGEGWSDPPEILSASPSGALNSQIVLDSGDQPHVVWQQTTGSNHQIYYSSKLGTGWSTPLMISTNSYNSQVPLIALGTNDLPHVVWKGNYNDIYYSTYSGSVWSTPVIISGASSGNGNPQIELDKDNHPHVVWDGISGSNRNIYYSTNLGSGWLAPQTLNLNDSTENNFPQIVLDIENFAYVVWQGKNSSAIFYSTNFGRGWSSPTNISPDLTSNNYPQIALDSDDLPHVVWRGSDGTTARVGYSYLTAKEYISTCYLAEGCTDGGFETWILVQNPWDEPVEIAMDFQTDIGLVPGPREAIPATSRRTYNVGSYVQTYNVSTTVTANDADVACERSMYGNERAWGHNSIGTFSAADCWYLAEGCTEGGMETWILVQNPEDTPVDVALDFQTDTGVVQGPRDIIPASSRRSYNVGDYVTTYNVSTKVSSSVGEIICERAMYGDNRTWGHDCIGINGTSLAWILTEGCTDGGFETWILVQNPGDTPAVMEMAFATDEEAVAGPSVTLPPHSRSSYNVGDYVTSYNVSTVVYCSQGEVICERAMYGNNRAWGHDSIGSPVTADFWFFAEGCTGGDFETWVLVMNASDETVEMTMAFLTAEGMAPGPKESIPPFTRRSYNVGNYVTSYDVSIIVLADKPNIICERSMYGNNRIWGHCSIGYFGY